MKKINFILLISLVFLVSCHGESSREDNFKTALNILNEDGDNIEITHMVYL